MNLIPQIELQPGYYFSPGFYKDFWINCIEKQFTEQTKLTNNKLKPYREVWIGAIFAALQTKITGIQHFVGLPPNEPPDIWVGRYVPVTTPKGRSGTNFDRMPIEITRCNLDAQETLFGQIKKKNKSAYSDTILLVYIYGAGKEVNFQEVADKIKLMGRVYPSEILVIGQVDKTSNGIVFPRGTFAQTKLYPDGGQDIVNTSDNSAFFRNPEVMTSLKRGVSRDLKELGRMMLVPPKIT